MMHFVKGQGTHKWAAVSFITNAAQVTFCCVIINLSDRISLVTMLLCLLLSTFYAKIQGSLKYVNGYIGDWKESTQHGYGTFTRDNGDVYVGERKDGKSHGHGTYEYANGDVYVGERKDDKRHGHGTYKWADGDTHTGEWKGDDRHGLGTFKYASNGDEYSGYWEHGER